MNKKRLTDIRNQRFRTGNNPDVVLPVPPSEVTLPQDYAPFFADLKNRIQQERLRTVSYANKALIMLYWDIGKLIAEKQNAEGWGAGVIDRLAADLKKCFPEMSGFSPRNLKYMRTFHLAWPEREIVQRTVAQIPWRSNLTLLEKLKSDEIRLWYAEKAVENGWSRDILALQIDNRLYDRTGKTANNFETSLPPSDSDMAVQTFKDPYIFDFLGNSEIRRESELEQQLIDHLEKFLLELGQGFAFVGRQVHLEVGEDDLYIDLLFYHLKLRCFVVIELKTGKFEHGHVSQLTTYMNIVDDVLRHENDNKTIGLLLVKEKNHTLVKYALAGYANPVGVAQWEQQIADALPDNLRPSLPTVEEIEHELDNTQ